MSQSNNANNNKTNANRNRRVRQKQARRNPNRVVMHIEPPIPKPRYAEGMSRPGQDKRRIASEFSKQQSIKSQQTVDFLENSLIPRRAFGHVKDGNQLTSRFIATTRFEIPPNPSGLGAIMFDTNPMYPIRYLKQYSDEQQFTSKGTQDMHHITTTSSTTRICTRLPMVSSGNVLKPEECAGVSYASGGLKEVGYRYVGNFSGDVFIKVQNNESSAIDVRPGIQNWSSQSTSTVLNGAVVTIPAKSTVTMTVTISSTTTYGVSVQILTVAQVDNISLDHLSTAFTSSEGYNWVPMGFIGVSANTEIAAELLKKSSLFAVTGADCLVSNYNNQFVANGLLSMMEIPPQSFEDLPQTPQDLINYIPSSPYIQKIVSAPLKDGGHYSWAPTLMSDLNLHPIPNDNTYFLYGNSNRCGALFAFSSQADSLQPLITTINMNIELITDERVIPPRACPHTIVLFSHWMAFLSEHNRFSSNAGHIKKVANLTKKFIKSDEGKQLLSFLGKTALAALAMI